MRITDRVHAMRKSWAKSWYAEILKLPAEKKDRSLKKLRKWCTEKEVPFPEHKD